MTATRDFLAAKKAKGAKRRRLLDFIARKNAPLADSYAIKFASQWRLEHILDDLKQQARLAMIKAVDSYRPIGLQKNRPGTDGSKHFANWFWFICRDELQGCARRLGEDVHPGTHSHRGQPRAQHTGIAAEACAGAVVLGASGNQELMARIAELPDLERKVIQALAWGDKPRAIGKAFGVVDIEGLIAGIREKLT